MNLQSTFGDSDYSQKVRDLFSDLEELDEINITDFLETLTLATGDEGTPSN